MSRALVSVVIPTFRRPDALRRALTSALDQSDAGAFEVVVVDNDPARSAEPVVRALQAGARVRVVYAHAPVPGVANARNVGVNAAGGDFIAFLDDDETAPPTWLGGLMGVQARFEADVVFGPVQACVPEQVAHRRYLQTFFSRPGPAESGELDRYYGCGNSLIRRGALPDATAPFSPERNQTGGEDDLLFSAMKRDGARFAWAADAGVFEHPEPSRLNLAYTLKRAFAYGQGPASDCWAAGPARWAAIPVWMGWGLAQAIGFGAASALQWTARGQARAYTFDRAARGLGKLLWFPPFKIGFYGA